MCGRFNVIDNPGLQALLADLGIDLSLPSRTNIAPTEQVSLVSAEPGGNALREARCPIGLINGSVDPVSGEHMVQRFEELVGDGHFIRRLEAIGHYPQIEAPEGVLTGYREFLVMATSTDR